MDSNINAGLLLTDQILEQIEHGFIACNRCGDQEETKNLDFVSDIKEVKNLLLNLAKKDQLEESKIKNIRAEIKEKILYDLQASYDTDMFNACGDNSQPLIDLEAAKCAVDEHL